MHGSGVALRAAARLRRVGCCLALAALLLLRGSQASAAPEEARAQAEAHFERGLSLAKTGKDWEAALSEFLLSRKLYATRSATRNAAIALHRLGRYADAIAMYETLVAEFSSTISSEELEQVSAERAALLERVGELGIEPAELDMNVVVDGEQRGQTPLPKPIRLDAGVHTVRLSKDGFETLERQVNIAAGGKRVIDGRLRAQLGTGTLVVSELGGEPLDVFVDRALVGRAPWRGNVAAGRHSVLLRSEHRGTAPIAVDVKETQVTPLALRAINLSADVVVEPDPASSTIFVDGVFVGTGSWSGALPSGPHRFEAAAPGRLPFRVDVVLEAGTRSTVPAVLPDGHVEVAREQSKPGPFYAEPAFGLLLGRSLRGDADAACGCDTRSRPFGLLGAVRAGYSFRSGWAVELGGGFLTISESMTRPLTATGDPGTSLLRSRDFHDETSLFGPFATVGASARFFQRFPLTTRVSAGVAALVSKSSGSGTFAGTVQDDRGVTQSLNSPLDLSEATHRLLTPFVSSEVRLGYRITERLSADFGLALYAFFPPTVFRSGRRATLGGDADKARLAGVLVIPDEAVARAFVTLSPSVAVRARF